ncbi:MAG TPA: hypothetical protein VFM55_19520 [Micromonosporaceae bacterium]|nr:hypothetical protein [Micromonosporaceae bacterium]
MARAHRQPPPAAAALLLATVVTVVAALLVPMFAAPAANLAPRDLPVVVAGTGPAAAALADRLSTAQPGAFDITTVADAAAADAALRERRAYAAFVAGADGVALHTASAASPTVAALLTQAAQQLGNAPPAVTDVVPADPDDPRGAGFAAGFLPLALTGMLAGILLAFVVRSRWARLLGLGAYALLSGLAGAAVLQSWLGLVPGNLLADAAAIGLFSLALAAVLAGLGAVLGRAGLALGVVAVFLVGNPLSAVAAAPQLLPQPWGEVGQWLPIGAGGTLLRSVAFFDGAGGARAAWILAGYALAGLVLVLVGRAVVGPAPAAGAAAAARAGSLRQAA